MEAPRRSPRVDVDHSGGRLHYLFSPWPSTTRTHIWTPLPLRPWTGIRKSGVVDSGVCQGAKSPQSHPGAETKTIHDCGSCAVSSSTTYAIVRSYIRFGEGEWERREGIGGGWGPETNAGSIHGRALCGLWFVDEQEGLVRMRRGDIEPCPFFFPLRTLFFSSATVSACLPSPPPKRTPVPCVFHPLIAVAKSDRPIALGGGGGRGGNVPSIGS